MRRSTKRRIRELEAEGGEEEEEEEEEDQEEGEENMQ